jgi:ketosteroid isomerase-like protein
VSVRIGDEVVNKCLLLLLLIASTCVQVTLAQKVSTPPTQTALEAELRQLERDWDTAIVHKDIARLEQILGDDFVYIGSAGGINPRAALIQGIKDSEATIEPFETTDVVVRTYGDTAILTGRFLQKGTYKGQSFSGQFRYTDVYVKRNGIWRAVSAHASRIADEKK